MQQLLLQDFLESLQSRKNDLEAQVLNLDQAQKTQSLAKDKDKTQATPDRPSKLDFR